VAALAINGAPCTFGCSLVRFLTSVSMPSDRYSPASAATGSTHDLSTELCGHSPGGESHITMGVLSCSNYRRTCITYARQTYGTIERAATHIARFINRRCIKPPLARVSTVHVSAVRVTVVHYIGLHLASPVNVNPDKIQVKRDDS
jgi:hypothetical protein